jgi:hypothetical protein
MAAKDFRLILTALREQGWRLENSSNSAHYKAFPPDTTKPMVCFSTTSGDHRALKNMLRDLRASGFEWDGSGPRSIPEQEEPPTEYETKEEPVEEQEMSQEADSRIPDQLFLELKESRKYAALAKEALAESKKAFEEAQLALKGSEEEYERAVEQMNLCKRRFDKAFSSEGL